MPLGQIPVLEYNGTKLPQSLAIARFLAKQGQLAGDDNLEQAKVDAVVDTANDTLAVFLSTFNEKDETKKKELIKKIFDEDLQNLETLAKLYGNGGSFFVGNKLTWADLFVYVVLENFLEMNSDCLNNYPWLKQNYKEVENQSRIAEHIKNRPITPF